MSNIGIRYDLDRNSLAISEKYFDESLFSFKVNNYLYDWKTKSMGWVEQMYNIYSKDRKTKEYLIPIGMLMYFYNTVSNAPQELLDWCLSEIKSGITLTDQDCLYQEQWEDLKLLVSFRRGVNQSYTGSGKTQAIAVLIKNLLKDYHGNILVAGPKNMILDEIKTRLESFELYKPSYFDKTQRVNCINPNGVCSSNLYKSGELDTWLGSVRFVICDEVDKLSDTSIELFHKLERSGCKIFWGFSATAKKDDAREIPCTRQLMGVMTYDLLAVVSTFSHSVIYKLPTDFNIQLINVFMGRPDLSYLTSDIGSEEYAHSFGYYTSQTFIQFLDYLMTKCKPLIPIYYTTIIDEWVKHFSNKRLVVLCGSGYLIMEEGEVVDHIDNKDLKYLVKYDDFDAIFTTVSGFAALDCPELCDVALLSGNSAGAVIQYIGRVARKKDFRIWYANHNRRIPIITSTREKQLNLIRDYYRLCNVEEITINYGSQS